MTTPAPREERKANRRGAARLAAVMPPPAPTALLPETVLLVTVSALRIVAVALAVAEAA